MIAQRMPNDRATLRPAALLDGVNQLHGELAVAWSRTPEPVGRGGARAAVARAAGRAVSRLIGCAEELVAIAHQTGARPIAMRRHAGTAVVLPCTVAVAHDDRRAIAAAAPHGRRIGIDLERAGRVEPADLRMFTTSAERALGLDPTLVWVLKQAAWKALGSSDRLSFTALSIAAYSISRSAPTHVVFSRHGEFFVGSAYTWQPWTGWLASVVDIA